jgi:hypothetical protein
MERLKPHNHTVSLHKTPQKELKPRNAALGPRGRCGRLNSGELAGGLGRGSGWGGSRVHEGAICVLTCGGERTGGRARRKSAATAAGMVTPASLRSSLGNK